MIQNTMSVPWKVRLLFNQYILGKSHKYGVKIYKVASSTGYTWNFMVYTGKQSSIAGQGHAETVLTTSLQLFLLPNIYYKIIRVISEHSEIIVLDQHGEVYGRHSKDSIKLTKWKDKRDVQIISTKPSRSTTVIDTKNTNKLNERIMEPQVILDYNEGKQDINLSDQLSSYYTCLRQSIKRYQKVAFQSIFGTSIANAYLICKENYGTSNMTMLQFHESLVRSLLLGEPFENLKPGPEQQPANQKKREHIGHLLGGMNGSVRNARRRWIDCYEKTRQQQSREASAITANRSHLQYIFERAKHIMVSWERITQMFGVYAGFTIFCFSLFGSIMNVIVFSTVRMYRGQPCTFFLLISAIVRSVHIFSIGLSRILAVVFHIDLILASLVWCKMRSFIVQTGFCVSMTCECLAAIDRFLVSSRSVKLRRLSKIKRAYRISIGVISFWLLQNAPYFIFVNINSGICNIYNQFWEIYSNYIIYWFLLTAVPLIICILFGSLAYRNMQTLKSLNQLQGADRQLINMIIGQVVATVAPIIPSGIFYIYSSSAISVSSTASKGIDYFSLDSTAVGEAQGPRVKD
ncbi:unnamed protein product [Adineta ricciae]|uniref:G-protein coupled receptors family 1 profile domain-containing protein n=1 Tax=Adineta ricciae TaxID=249248 RepID=A0A816A1A3_ADIRI|nr:unnamed protein product [Adineta ricciae]CAF1592075.1 unnamed protein product [Adineta ricciae]